jgi:hypothetical protein
MLRYAHLLDAVEFTKFVVLVRDLSPFAVALIDPESRSRRLDRNPAIGRQNLQWLLSGHPAAVPLFSGHRRAPEVAVEQPARPPQRSPPPARIENRTEAGFDAEAVIESRQVFERTRVDCPSGGCSRFADISVAV